jgi:aconitate hydratase
MLAKEGLLGDLVSAGARILENACGFCIGNHASPGTDAVSLRTSNRNFEGRSGTRSAQVYLVSPETAAAAALTGVFTDARELGRDGSPSRPHGGFGETALPLVDEPDVYDIDDSMFLFRETAGKGAADIQIVRGPNIGEVPRGKPLPENLHGIATIKVGDKITTDHIMPAGARLKYRSNVPQYSKYVFEHTDPEFYSRASAIRDRRQSNFIIAGDSYGQGSSREHAAMCPMYLGVKAVIAKSIERIHWANLVNFGIVPFTFVNPSDYDKIQQEDRLIIKGLREAIEGDGKAIVTNETKGTFFRVSVTLSKRQKKILLNGGLLAAVANGAV